MQLTPDGNEVFGHSGEPLTVRYHNGPIVSRAGIPELSDYQVLAWFRSEVSRYETQRGTMINTPAIVSGKFGKGRVLSISPHPESSQNLHPLVARAIRWAGGP